MEKLIFSVFTLTVCALAFVSCKKDDDGFSNNDIIGEWVQTRYYDSDYEEWEYIDEYTSYTFKKNGSGIYAHEDDYDFYDADFEYSIDGNSLSIELEDYTENQSNRER
ncbi:MAG: hypothetical protein NC396_05615 [Bacteroides sp.]|nr:hypothetical protein [Bacteroides sp.]MCM1085832.1 hypothetical protein [Bacteroides sp.]